MCSTRAQILCLWQTCLGVRIPTEDCWPGLCMVALHPRCPAGFCRCSHGIDKLHVSQVLAQYLGWFPRHPSPQYHLGIQGSPGPQGVCLSGPSQLPNHPASCQAVPTVSCQPRGPGLLLSVALRNKLEGDVFNYCNHYLISSLPGSIHPASFILPLSSPCAIPMGVVFPQRLIGVFSV